MSAIAAPSVVPAFVSPVPRVVGFVVVKRNLSVVGRTYGHWWVEVDDTESYGWWPARSPLRLRDLLLGVPGVLNGVGPSDGCPTQDPNHGLVADHEFHPVLMLARTDDEVRDTLRCFASDFRGEWRWSARPAMNCRLFQLALLEAAGLVDGTGNYHTRGRGCPALAPLRRLASRVGGQRHWPRNLPAPGQRLADLVGAGGRNATPHAQAEARPLESLAPAIAQGHGRRICDIV